MKSRIIEIEDNQYREDNSQWPPVAIYMTKVCYSNSFILKNLNLASVLSLPSIIAEIIKPPCLIFFPRCCWLQRHCCHWRLLAVIAVSSVSSLATPSLAHQRQRIHKLLAVLIFWLSNCSSLLSKTNRWTLFLLHDRRLLEFFHYIHFLPFIDQPT